MTKADLLELELSAHLRQSMRSISRATVFNIDGSHYLSARGRPGRVGDTLER